MDVWQRSRGCRGCSAVRKCGCKFSSPTYFATSMSSCGFCDCDEYDHNSRARGIGVLWRMNDGCETVIKKSGGNIVVTK